MMTKKQSQEWAREEIKRLRTEIAVLEMTTRNLEGITDRELEIGWLEIIAS